MEAYGGGGASASPTEEGGAAPAWASLWSGPDASALADAEVQGCCSTLEVSEESSSLCNCKRRRGFRVVGTSPSSDHLIICSRRRPSLVAGMLGGLSNAAPDSILATTWDCLTRQQPPGGNNLVFTLQSWIRLLFWTLVLINSLIPTSCYRLVAAVGIIALLNDSFLNTHYHKTKCCFFRFIIYF